MMFYIHKDGYLYSGDMTDGAREATPEEIAAHLGQSQIVTPAADQDIADLWQAMLTMSAELDVLKGGA